MPLSDSPTERSTAATDLLLSIVALSGLLYLHAAQPGGAWRIQLWSWPLGLIAGSAGLGALYHGLVWPRGLRNAVWQALTFLLGMALALFGAGLTLDLFGPEAGRRSLPLWLATGALVFLVSRRWNGLFRVFIVFEGVVLAAALVGYTALAAASALSGAGWIAAGVLLSGIAAALQACNGLRFKWIWEFDHNGIFHLVQTAGLVLLCKGIAGGG
ncbi:MAG: hypothetical protein MUD16_04450 [Desulfobacterales bacterium]|jgi:hypothetical protein|nr:hypothetical protein [Desulfobacterales bacterium]